MTTLQDLITDGYIGVEDLASAKELVDRAELVINGIEACKRTLAFPLGTSRIKCYAFADTAKEYESNGYLTADGTFTCYCNCGKHFSTHLCNLMNPKEVFMAFENREFADDLRRFLLQQISKAEIVQRFSDLSADELLDKLIYLFEFSPFRRDK